MHYDLINAMPQLICILDAAGTIVFVNRAWITAGVSRGIPADFDWSGINYLKMQVMNDYAEHPTAREILDMIAEVLSGQRISLSLEYPCHSMQERHWFQLSVTPFKHAAQPLFIVSHTDISQIQLRLEEAQLLCLQDPLTAIANRRHFNQYFQETFTRSIQEGKALSLMLLDIDHFKRINDVYGHHTGDDLLISIANMLSQLSQTQPALAARLGGDEYAVVTQTPLCQAIDLSRALLHQVEQLNQTYSVARDVRISVSIGIACTSPSTLDEKDLLYAMADKNLYKAKQAGRNRVEAGMLNGMYH